MHVLKLELHRLINIMTTRVGGPSRRPYVCIAGGTECSYARDVAHNRSELVLNGIRVAVALLAAT